MLCKGPPANPEGNRKGDRKRPENDNKGRINHRRSHAHLIKRNKPANRDDYNLREEGRPLRDVEFL